MSRSSRDRIKPQASSHCPSAGSSNAPSLGSAAADDWPRTGNASTTRRSPSCASPPSASCCENYAIPHDVLGQTLRIVAGRKEELGCSNVADRIPGDEVRRQLVDNGCNHRIEIGDLIVQFEVPAAQGLEP